MTREDMAILLAKIQLGDNRHVDGLVLDYWLDTIGDLDIQDALAALKRFRRERPGTYLEPGHLLELAGVQDPELAPVRDLDPEWLAETKQIALAGFGYTTEQYDADPAVRADVAARWTQRQIVSTDG